jgi:hypothetical protein
MFLYLFICWWASNPGSHSCKARTVPQGTPQPHVLVYLGDVFVVQCWGLNQGFMHARWVLLHSAKLPVPAEGFYFFLCFNMHVLIVRRSFVVIFLHMCILYFFFFFFFALLGLELRAFTLSHSTNPIFVKGFQDRVSQELFTWAGLEPWSSWSLLPE